MSARTLAPTRTALRCTGWPWAWLVIIVPFAVTAAFGGPASGRLLPHGPYHLIYIAVIAGAIVQLRRLRTLSAPRTVRALALGTIALQTVALGGHIGEWVSTLPDGEYVEDGTGTVKGNGHLHSLFANITVPALVASMVLVLVLTLVVLRDRSGTAGHGHPRIAARPPTASRLSTTN